MKLAYFSPLPPQKSGISDYSEALLPYLSRYFTIDLWVTDVPQKRIAENYHVVNYHARKIPQHGLEDYDIVLYNIGNNPEYHGEMYDAFLENPGYVILHDFVLYFLITGYYLGQKQNSPGYIRAFFENFGNAGIHEVKKILRSPKPPLQYEYPERYPLVRNIIQNARGIIVHSEYSRRLLIANGCPEHKVVKINQVNYSNMNLQGLGQDPTGIREEFGIRADALLITSLGYIAPTKRNAEIIRAVNEIICASGRDIQYLMVGEGNYIDGLLDGNIKKTGYVPRDRYEQLLCSSDIVVNLRNPSMGETSATVLQAMTAGKPCIVSDVAWFSELPDEIVEKISIDPLRENQELKNALQSLISDSQKRKDLSIKSTCYVQEYHNPGDIAGRISSFLIPHMPVTPTDFDSVISDRLNRAESDIFFRDIHDQFQRKYEKRTSERLIDMGFKAKTGGGILRRIKEWFIEK